MINEISKEFEVNTKKLDKTVEIITHFCNEMNKGLEKRGQNLAVVPSYGKFHRFL